MSTHTSQIYPTIFQGQAQIPDKFVVNYKSAPASAAQITVKGIKEEDGTLVTIVSAYTLDAQNYAAPILAAVFTPIIGYFFEITNIEFLKELESVVMVSKHGIPITNYFNT